MAGCGPSQRAAAPDNARQDRVELDEPTEHVGPEPVTPRNQTTSREATPEAPAPIRPETTPTNAWRRDGRPVWWLAAPTRADGRLTLSAEAIADDVLAARRAAVDAGRAALGREIGGGAGAAVDERIEAITVRRLGADRPGGERYVGYVLISARLNG